MTMRGELKRPETITDDWNRQTQSGLTSLGTTACRVYTGSAKLIIKDDKTAQVDELRVMFPLDTDVKAEDTLVNVQDRRGKVLFAGPFIVKTPLRKVRQIQASLQGHSV
mgnify:CR=1 FL=1